MTTHTYTLWTTVPLLVIVMYVGPNDSNTCGLTTMPLAYGKGSRLTSTNGKTLLAEETSGVNAVPCGFCARPDRPDIAYANHLANPADSPSDPQSANEEPGPNTSRRLPSRRTHDIEAPTTSTRPGPSRHPKVSPRSQHRFQVRSPPRLELVTSSS